MKKLSTISFILISAAALMAFCIQSDFAGVLQDKLIRFYTRHKPVKIHLVFNQPAYAPGDTAFFKVHFFAADNFLPIRGRQLVNIQLTNSSGQMVFHDKVLLVDGEGFNQIPLDEKVAPGRYTVVAYSDVMKNADPSLFFQCPLWISGPTVLEEAGSGQAIEFHAEGGRLVAGIANRMVVKGYPNTTGDILSSNGNRAASVRLDEYGLGSFFLTPLEGASYYAVFGGGSRIELPIAEKDGIGILATVPANNLPVRVTLQVPQSSSFKREKLMLTMTGHATIYFAAELSFNDKNIVVVSIPQTNVPEGISQLSIFRNDGRNVANRLLYIGRSSQAQVRIGLERRDFLTREKIPLTVTIGDDAGQPLRSSLTVTVYSDDLLPPGTGIANGSIVSNALFYGDLAGSMSAPPFFQPHSSNAPPDPDNYLITQEWMHFRWQDVLNEKMPLRDFQEYLHFEGRAFLTGGDELPDSTLLSFFIQKSVITYEIYLDASGRFDFPLLFDFYGEEEIFYRAESKGKLLEDIRVEFDPPAAFPARTPQVKSLLKTDEYFSFSRQKQMIDRSYAHHLRPHIYAEPPSLNALVEEEIFGADVVVKFEDYFLFPTMSETLREIIPLLEHRKSKGRDVVRLFMEERNRYSEDEPLFIIDGVITDNTAYFLGLNPSEVVGIKIIHGVNKLATFGSIGKNGIVLVETKIPNHAALVPRSEYTLTARGLRASSASHRYAEGGTKDARVPDLRANLYWNPAVRTDSSGTASISFNASDVTGRFRVRIEGLTEEGQPFFAEDTFKVSFRSQ